jgi:hypothetical protein
MRNLVDRVGRVTQTDRLFFERFPHRRHRVRIASQAEIEHDLALTGSRMMMPPGKQLFVAVKNIAPGVRLRLLVVGLRDADTDLNEGQAHLVYELANSDKCREVEAQLLDVAEALK